MLDFFVSLVFLSFIMAHVIPNLLLARLRQMPLTPQHRETPEPRPSDKTDADDGTYYPNPIDIVVVRIMLTRSVKLPPDLVDTIFDYAEYWAHSTNVIDYQAEQQEPLRICGSSQTEDKFLLRSYPVGLTGIEGQDTLSKELAYDTHEATPLPREADCDAKYFAKLAKYPTPRLINPVRKVVFKIRSHDQGWGGDNTHKGTYKASWTWFEAGLEKFDAAQTCDAKCTQDVRQEAPESENSLLPVCGLRAVYPIIQQRPKNENDETLEENEDRNGNQPEVQYQYVHPLHGNPEWEIQRNLMAISDWQEHVVTWSYSDDIKADSDAGKALDDQGRGRATGDGLFVRNLVLGDVITVWGKARFGGWVNNVDSVKIEVYWAV